MASPRVSSSLPLTHKAHSGLENFEVLKTVLLPTVLLPAVLLTYHMTLNKLFSHHYPHLGASLVAQIVKNLPAMQETWVWSLGQEDAPRISQTEEPGGLQSMGLQRVGHIWVTNTSHFTSSSVKIGVKLYLAPRVLERINLYNTFKIINLEYVFN